MFYSAKNSFIEFFDAAYKLHRAWIDEYSFLFNVQFYNKVRCIVK